MTASDAELPGRPSADSVASEYVVHEVFNLRPNSLRSHL